MKLSVGSTPQAVFPFGEQEVYTLTNDGPWTVFVDSDTSVSPQSIALPATASIVWDALRPLHVMAAGDTSTLVLTRNSGIVDAARASVDAVVFQANQVDAQTVGTGYDTGVVECSSYNTLDIRFSDNVSQANSSPPNDGYNVEVSFYNHASAVLDTIPIETIKFKVPGPSFANGSVGAMHIVCPIRGAYFSVEFSPLQDRNNLLDITISATSREKRMSWYFITQTNGKSDPATGSYSTSASTHDSWIIDEGGSTPSESWLAPIKPLLQYNVRWSANITTAGLFVLRNMWDESVLLVRDALPVGAAGVISGTIRIPETSGIFHDIVMPVGGGTIMTQFTWSDV